MPNEQQRSEGIAGFYDWLAPDYDSMTGFDQRFVREEPVFREIVRSRGITTAVDAGCGTGFHSILLARLGVRVTSVDLSPKMLEALDERARRETLPITTLASSFQELGSRIPSPVDAVFCMGNSLPHLLRDEDLQASVESFGAALRRSGLLVLQIVNFERILSSGERVQSVRESGGTIYVRFYDLEGTSVRFNILRLTKHPTGVSHDLRSVNLRPISRGAIVDLLSAAGFEDPQVYGGVAGEGYDPGSSRDLVVFAVRRSS